MKKTVLLAALMAAFSASAFASDFYVGGNIGTVTNNNAGTALTKTRDTSYSLLGGYKITENIAAEVAYSDLGRTAQGAVTGKNSALSLSAVGTLPIANGFSAYGKLGFASARTAVSTGVTASHSDFTYGIGAEYAVNQNVSIRAGWDQVKLGNNITVVRSKDDIFNMGVNYRF
jgi:OOP family OmpA-OmpF porin